ncbi:MAG: nodulation protein S NodS [Candidatus Marinimicrobia bacterium]|nr:nodulation protein S NodS [Candidatus Neomarinimicrobiota bacterium]
MIHATDIFNKWALVGKDEGMEKHHASAVKEMLSYLIKGQLSPFTFIDAGCGNGWAVREMRAHTLCQKALGVDGAEYMIRNAKAIDPEGDYVRADLFNWTPTEKVDYIHSMEVLYYFENPADIIHHMKSNWLKPGGKMIMGVDFYKENETSHSWPTDLNTHMTLLSELEWESIFMNNGFSNIEKFRANVKGNKPGTLVISGVFDNDEQC